MQSETSISRQALLVALLASLFVTSMALAVTPKDSESYLGTKAFFRPDLYISTGHATLEEVLPELPNKAAWNDIRLQHKAAGVGDLRAYIDPRSGVATNIIGAFPVIPGKGVGNNLTAGEVARRLGLKATPTKMGRDTVAAAVLQWVEANKGALGIDTAQLGAIRAEPVTDTLWHASGQQTFAGIPVRYGRFVAAISHGNIITAGTEIWGNVRGISPRPSLSADEALDAGFAHVGGRSSLDVMLRPAELEIVPSAVENAGLGQGYAHTLAYVFAFQRAPEQEAWEIVVDAHSGEVLSMEDKNHYAQVTGGVYPMTNTNACPNPDQCGTMQDGWPMPFADVSNNTFANSAGLTGVANPSTNLDGQFVRISDQCGSISESASGDLDLGGTDGDHDCDRPAGASNGNTASARSAYYELSKLNELGRGWLPNNNWLQGQLTANVNINNTCNANYSSFQGVVNFYRSGGGCGNTGEIAGVFDHEWGHALDDNDSGGSFSNTSEAYADIVAIYRLHASCVGHGFFLTDDKGCGMTADGTGFNQNESQTGGSHCNLDCSGVRDADWRKHADNTPDTPLNFVCSECLSSSGPCGRQVHCSGAPPRQAAWDLVVQDLPAAGYDNESAFILGNKLFYQGSGLIGTWYSCTCGSSSSGCGSTNAYMQWIAADDDNGNLNDGTPHMAEIFAAFDRHGIACSSPTPQNGGCTGAPTTAPTLTASADVNAADLSWNTVSGANEYWVFRTEGVAGCDFGKARIATVTGTSFTDTEVAGGRDYHYNVVAAGSSDACFTQASACQTVTPIIGTPPPPPPPPPPPACSPKGASCSSNADCCSNKCKGKAGNQTCK